ncbi:MAG: PEP-CTERM sorting domain-containing protein [Gemmatimonadaceae bacterium]|nr:PEP-CTERM sorting domain-containing protein [Gemmatimonadaceae bacterium]
MLHRALIVLALTVSAAQAQLIGGGAGTTSNFMPLGGISNVGTPVANRYQQLFSASAWSSTTAIGGVRFFRASVDGSYRTQTLRISLSTSARAVTGAGRLDETNFDSNVGVDRLVLGTIALDGTTPATVQLLGPTFTFNPLAGNLLLDIEVLPGAGGNPTNRASHLARTNWGTGPVLFSRAHNFSSTAMYNEGWGLVTEFLPATVVPEPSALLMTVAGVCALAAFAARRRPRA